MEGRVTCVRMNVGAEVQLRRSYVKRKNMVGYKTELYEIPQLTVKGKELFPPTSSDMFRLERKLVMSKQRKGGNSGA